MRRQMVTTLYNNETKSDNDVNNDDVGSLFLFLYKLANLRK